MRISTTGAWSGLYRYLLSTVRNEHCQVPSAWKRPVAFSLHGRCPTAIPAVDVHHSWSTFGPTLWASFNASVEDRLGRSFSQFHSLYVQMRVSSNA